MTGNDSNDKRAVKDGASDAAHDVLEALNGEDAIDHPGRPSKAPASPADDADAPAP